MSKEGQGSFQFEQVGDKTEVTSGIEAQKIESSFIIVFIVGIDYLSLLFGV